MSEVDIHGGYYGKHPLESVLCKTYLYFVKRWTVFPPIENVIWIEN